MFAQPHIKVSTAATGEVLVARIKQSFEGDVCVRQVYLLMSTNIALRHAVPLATNTTLKTKKERNSRFSLMVPLDVLFSNEFLRDLSRLWELRTIISDPTKLYRTEVHLNNAKIKEYL